MARISGRNSYIVITDSTSASRNISGRSNTATLNLTSEEVDVTSFGAQNRERVADALKDWTFEGAGFWDGAASNIDEILHGVWAACTAFIFGPGGSTSTSVKYSGCAILQDYTIETAVDGAVTFSYTFVAASTLTRGSFS